MKRPLVPAAASLVLATVPSPQVGTTELVSVDSAGVQGPSASHGPSLSADGRLVAFDSESPLVAGDGNGARDVFLRDLALGTTIRLSETAAGVEGDGDSYSPVLTADGALCAFISEATNLVPGDGNGVADVFLKDLVTGEVTRVSVASDGSEADDTSVQVAISADGSRVAFLSLATNLVPPDLNPSWDVFVHDLATGATSLASKSGSGEQANSKCMDPALSPKGDLVAFASIADNLVPEDTNSSWDVFVHDLATGETTRASVSAAGEEAQCGSFDPTFTAGGALLAFAAEAVGLVPETVLFFSDVFVKDLATGAIELVSKSSEGRQGDLSSGSPAVSSDGRYVAFSSRAENLVPGDGTGPGGWDVFVHDRLTGETVRESVDVAGLDPDGTSSAPAISADGRIVVFESLASDLVPFDANGGVQDVFARERATDPWEDLGLGLAGALGVPALDAQGSLVPSNTTVFEISGAAADAPGAAVLGLARLDLPLFGGTLVPSLDFVLALTTGADGTAARPVVWPLLLPSGLELWAQGWLLDATAPQGFAASNALHSAVFDVAF